MQHHEPLFDEVLGRFQTVAEPDLGTGRRRKSLHGAQEDIEHRGNFHVQSGQGIVVVSLKERIVELVAQFLEEFAAALEQAGAACRQTCRHRRRRVVAAKLAGRRPALVMPGPGFNFFFQGGLRRADGLLVFSRRHVQGGPMRAWSRRNLRAAIRCKISLASVMAEFLEGGRRKEPSSLVKIGKLPCRALPNRPATAKTFKNFPTAAAKPALPPPVARPGQTGKNGRLALLAAANGTRLAKTSARSRLRIWVAQTFLSVPAPTRMSVPPPR